MGRKSTISRLPPEVKAYIEGRLAEGRMTLDELVSDLRAKFPAEKESGELPSRAAVHRYGQQLEQKLAMVRASTEAARIIYSHAGDDKDLRSAGLMAMVQSELFDALMLLQQANGEEVDPAERAMLLADIGKRLASMTNSSVNLKQFQAKVEAQVRKQVLEEQEEKLKEMRGSDGMSEQMEARIRRILLGKE